MISWDHIKAGLSGGYSTIEAWMSKMTNVGDHVRCPQCGGKACVVWVSQNGKTVAIRCMRSHSYDEKGSSTKISSYYKTKPKPKKKGMVFLIEATKNEWKLLCLHGVRRAHVYKKLPRSIGKWTSPQRAYLLGISRAIFFALTKRHWFPSTLISFNNPKRVRAYLQIARNIWRATYNYHLY